MQRWSAARGADFCMLRDASLLLVLALVLLRPQSHTFATLRCRLMRSWDQVTAHWTMEGLQLPNVCMLTDPIAREAVLLHQFEEVYDGRVQLLCKMVTAVAAGCQLHVVTEDALQRHRMQHDWCIAGPLLQQGHGFSAAIASEATSIIL